MCVLKIFSDTDSFKPWAETTGIQGYNAYDKGENVSKKRKAAQYRLSLDVSDKEWSDFAGQVADAQAFLAKHNDDLESLFQSHNIDAAFLDFPIYCRLKKNKIVNQNDHIPAALIQLAAALNLGIEMSLYDQEFMEQFDG